MNVLIISIIFLILLIYFIINYFLNLAINSTVSKKSVISKNENEELPFPKSKDENFIKKMEKVKKEYKIKSSFDNINLFYYVITNAKAKSNKYIFLVHGFGQGHEQLGHHAKIFYNLGYNLVLLDLRAHGKSEAKYIGMGVLDAKDLLDVILDFNKKYKDSLISLFGVSMGAATVLTSLNLKLPSNVKCVIEDSSYTSALEEFKYQARNNFHVPTFVVTILNIFCIIKAKYSFSEITPLKGVASTKLPILFIHAKRDFFVPFAMGQELYNKCNSKKYFLTMDKAAHIQIAYLNRKYYLDNCKQFLLENLKN